MISISINMCNQAFSKTKDINKIFYISFFLILLCCCKNVDEKVNDAGYVINDYTNYSMYYKIDVTGNDDKELFLVTKEIFVADSSFGIYNPDNLMKAKLWSLQQKDKPYIIYNIFIEENNEVV
ncbi:hypothetical protein CHU92_12815 [Flavobacterium cyanobacteriorum]|uniref:Uncharacterized protein n=1 Tax=Flavobacterium cyanobacteriorum TaxID=2022802 RepID=A0A255YVR5_9FLAO|nr:hypothetical protein [Flavobacterium cyanobacteriorum]OYQ33269.1 hypothetical protein CHU92_12815 [Flavobacterium cyanobacteriorum]